MMRRSRFAPRVLAASLQGLRPIRTQTTECEGCEGTERTGVEYRYRADAGKLTPGASAGVGIS